LSGGGLDSSFNLSCSGGSPPQQQFSHGSNCAGHTTPLNSVMNFLMRDPYSQTMSNSNGPSTPQQTNIAYDINCQIQL